jgi:hypothetical protein
MISRPSAIRKGIRKENALMLSRELHELKEAMTIG